MGVKEFWQELHLAVKVFTITGLVLLIYGELAKALNIYFFWESGYIGYFLLASSIGVVLIVELLIKIGVMKSYFRSGWQTVFRILFVILAIGINTIFHLSDSLEVAKELIEVDEGIKEVVGEVESFGYFISGSSSTHSDLQNTSTSAQYNLLVKGDKKFANVSVYISRENKEEWYFEILDISY